MRVLFIFLSIVVVGCSEKPEDAGLCSLNCSNAIIGPIEATIVNMASPSNYFCPSDQAGEAISDPFTFYWRIVTETPDELEANATKIVPVPTVSMEPVISGIMSDNPEHNPNVVIENGVFTPARYKGIVTPQENWCSDACGVVTMEVFADCPEVGETTEVKAQVHTGALFSDEATVQVTTQEPN